MTILPPNIQIFSLFLVIFLTDKLRSWVFFSVCLFFFFFFFVERVNLSWYSQKTRKEFEQFRLQNTKRYGGKIYSRTRTFDPKVHKSNMQVKRWHNKYEILNKIERNNFYLNSLPIKSKLTALQTYKVEEQTFGTPCSSIVPGSQTVN